MFYVILLCGAILTQELSPFTFLQYKTALVLVVFVVCVLQKSETRDVSKSFFLKRPWWGAPLPSSKRRFPTRREIRVKIDTELTNSHFSIHSFHYLKYLYFPDNFAPCGDTSLLAFVLNLYLHVFKRNACHLT